jgi:C_GCAxxG_C_C family probable redox protein
MDRDKGIEELVREARQKASSSPYRGCATAVFTALVDVLKIEHGDAAFKAMIGFAGGTGHLAKGTCGALAGAAAAISLSYNKSREDVLSVLNDPKALHAEDPHIPIFFQEIFEKTASVAEKMEEKYGSILCSNIQLKIFGKALDLLDPKRHWELCQSFSSHPTNCFTVEGDVAGWAVEAILNQ